MHFFNDGRFDQRCFADAREELRQFPHRKLDDVVARLVEQRLRRADHQFEIAACFARLAPRAQDLRLLEHPLNRPLQQHSMFQMSDFTVEPQVNARDWHRAEVGRLFPQRPHLRSIGQQLFDAIERSRQYRKVSRHFVAADSYTDTALVRLQRIDRRPQMNASTTDFDVRCRHAIQLRQRHRGKPHTPGFRRLQKRIAKHQRGITNRYLVQIVIERADKNRCPEAVNRTASSVRAARATTESLRYCRREAQASRPAALARSPACLSRRAPTTQERMGQYASAQVANLV